MKADSKNPEKNIQIPLNGYPTQQLIQMCLQVAKEGKQIMVTILLTSIIVCVPLIGVDGAFLSGGISDEWECVAAAFMCLWVDFWSEVFLVVCLIVISIIACSAEETDLRIILNITCAYLVPLCVCLIGWYCYCFYVVANTLSVLESYGVDCGRVTPYMISLGVIGIITKIILIILLSMRPSKVTLQKAAIGAHRALSTERRL